MNKFRFFIILALIMLYWQDLMGQVHRISDGDFVGCQGLFVDSGDLSGDYGPGENYTITMCPDGSTGSYIRLTFSSPDIRPGDMLCFYDGPNILAPSLGCNISFLPGAPFIIQATAQNPTGCVTVTFTSNTAAVGKGWNAQITCEPACQIFDAQITQTLPAANPIDTGWIDICPGEAVAVSATALFYQNNLVYPQDDSLCIFEWDFGDGNLLRGQSVQNTYKSPGGYNISLTIIDQLGCRNTNFVSQKVRVAPPPRITIDNLPGPICYGDTLTLSAADTTGPNTQVNVESVEGRFDVRKVRADSLPLPDGNGAKYSTSLVFNEFPPDKFLTDPNQILSICANMEHSWMRDLRITLTCPSGKEIILVNQEETGDEVFLGIPYEDDELLAVPIPGIGWTYCWTHEAPNGTWLDYANTYNPQTLPSDTYSTYESMENLIGCPLNGEWILTIQDLWPIDNGYIFWWDITFDETLVPFVETFKPIVTQLRWDDHANIITHKEKEIQAIADQAGEVFFRLTYTDNFNCQSDTFVILPVRSPTHPECMDCLPLLELTDDTSLCSSDALQLSATHTGFAGGSITFAHYPWAPVGFSNHPPANPYFAPIEVENLFPLTLSAGAAEIESVCFTLQTNPVNNIAAHLITPDGKQLALVTYKGGLQQNFHKTCFAPGASTPILGATAPFTGTFAAEGNWNTLAGSPVNGTWQLMLSDNFGISRMGLFEEWSITMRATNDVTYQWTPSEGLSCTDCPNPTAQPASSMVYQLVTSDAYQCSATGTVQLHVEPTLEAPTIACGESTPAGLRIYWNEVPGATNYVINVNNEGWGPTQSLDEHLITGYNVGDTLQIAVKADDQMLICPADIGEASCRYFFCQMFAVVEQVNPPSCYGGNDGQAFISAFNGISPFVYTLNGTLSQPIGFFNGVPAGNHFVEIRDANNCRDTVYFTLGQPDPISFDIAITSVSCFGAGDGSATANAIGGTGDKSFIWLTFPAVFGPTISNRPPGTYNLRALDVNNCSRDTSIIITEPAPIDVIISATPASCVGASDGSASALVSGGTPPYSYLWTDPLSQTTATASNISSGVYEVLVTDNNGCSMVVTATVEGSTLNTYLPQASVPICAGLANGKAWVEVVQAPLPVTYTWIDPVILMADTLTAAAGTYRVLATDGNGCTDTLLVTIPEQMPLLSSVDYSPEVCPNASDGQATISVLSGGTGPYTYAWSVPPGASGPVVNGLTAGVYGVTVTDSNGCTSSSFFNIDEAEGLLLALDSQPASCTSSTDGSATVAVTQGVSPFEFYWNDPGQTQGAILTNVSPGTYTVTVTASNACTASGQVTIGSLNAFALDHVTIQHPTCHDAADGSVSLDFSGGAGAITIQWAPSGLPSASQLSNLASGTYAVTLTDEAGCTVASIVTLDAPSPLEVAIEQGHIRCYGESNGQLVAVGIGGTAPYMYQWSGASPSSSGILGQVAAGQYGLTLTDANQCALSTQVSLTQPEALMLYLLTDAPNCNEPRSGVIEVDVFGGVEPYSYVLNGGLMQSTGVFTLLESGNYSIQVMDANGCQISEMTTLEQDEAFELALPIDLSIDLGESVALTPQYADSLLLQFLWQAPYEGTLSCVSCEVPIASPLFTTTYTLHASDDMGCTVSRQITVYVRPNRVVLVPSAFTPNGDGRNDMLLVHGKEGTHIHRFQVFNRWGELIFESHDFGINNPTIGWDGSYRGEQMNAGVYIWSLEVEYADGFRDVLSGQTNLIR